MPISSHLAAVRAKVGHDLLTITAASISVFDSSGRLLLGEDTGTGGWTLPGGAIDPNENPADAAVRECFEETGLLVKPERVVGVFGGPEFLVRYPNGDLTYYTTIAFEASVPMFTIAELALLHRVDTQFLAQLTVVNKGYVHPISVYHLKLPENEPDHIRLSGNVRIEFVAISEWVGPVSSCLSLFTSVFRSTSSTSLFGLSVSDTSVGMLGSSGVRF